MFIWLNKSLTINGTIISAGWYLIIMQRCTLNKVINKCLNKIINVEINV